MKVNMGQPNDLLLDDLELILREIDEFNSAPLNNKPANISQSLENYLQFVAKSGNTVFPWPHVRNLIRTKMVNAIQQFQEPTCPNESFVLERFDLFRLAAPFTVQRLTELIIQPTRHYRKKEKFLRGLEKTVLVVSTVEPHSLTNDEEKNGNDINNTSSSSCEAETETVAFNRTITLDSHDLLTTAVRTSSSMDVISHEGVVLDPVTVTTTAIATHDDVINQNITITSAGGIISENVITSAISSDEVITPDKVTVLSTDAVSLEVASDTLATTTTTGVESMDSSGEEVQDILTTSIEVMEEGTSESLVLDPISSAVGTTVDVVSQDICVLPIGTSPENVTTSTVHSVGVIIPDSDKVVEVSSEPVILNAADAPASSESVILNAPDASASAESVLLNAPEAAASTAAAEVLLVDHSSIDAVDESPSEGMILDTVSSVEIISPNSGGVIPEAVATSTVDSLGGHLTPASLEEGVAAEVSSVASADEISMDSSEGEGRPLDSNIS